MGPICKGTFERRNELESDYPEMTALSRDHRIAWSKDLAVRSTLWRRARTSITGSSGIWAP